jgi:spermidine synthase
VHLGGGGFTLPRYVAASRPGSRQQVIESNRALIDAVRAQLPLPKREQIKVRCADAAEAGAVLPTGLDGNVELLVLDVFAGARTPASLTTGEFFDSLTPLLAPGATVALNIGDGPPLAFARSMAATVGEVFGPVAIAAEPAILKGRRFGNLVLVAGSIPDGLARRLAGDPFPGTLIDGSALVRFIGGARPITSANAQDSPAPPRGVFG